MVHLSSPAQTELVLLRWERRPRASLPATSEAPRLQLTTSRSDLSSPEKLWWCLVSPWELQSGSRLCCGHLAATTCRCVAGEGVCHIPSARGCLGTAFHLLTHLCGLRTCVPTVHQPGTRGALPGETFVGIFLAATREPAEKVQLTFFSWGLQGICACLVNTT